MILLMVLKLLSSPVFANPTGEFYFQPEQGAHAAHGAVSQTRTRYKTENGRISFDKRSFEANYLYGFTSDVSAGLTLNYTKTESEGSASVSGLDDIEFNLRGTKEMAEGRLRYGANFEWSPEPSKSDSNGDTKNQFSGANTLTPYIGYELMVPSKGYLGLSLSQGLLLGKRVDEDANGDKTKSSGGTLTTVNLYYEHFIEKNAYSAILSYSKIKDTKYDSSTSEGLALWGLQLLARQEVMPNLFVIPRFAYGEALDDTINNVKIDKIYVISFFVGARYLF